MHVSRSTEFIVLVRPRKKKSFRLFWTASKTDDRYDYYSINTVFDEMMFLTTYCQIYRFRFIDPNSRERTHVLLIRITLIGFYSIWLSHISSTVSAFTDF